MSHGTYLITGGAGFVGTHLACRLKETREDAKVTALDNLRRRGSERNLSRLSDHDVRFLHGDVRNTEDLAATGDFDILIDCSAEPSVLAGYQKGAGYVVNTNLVGTINCLELARTRGAGFVFLSTSRVYPLAAVNAIRCTETESRFAIASEQDLAGVSPLGITESFPLDGARSLYGATKLCSELILQEYVEAFGLRGVINRCGLITGPGQAPKIDQGVVALWVLQHIMDGHLDYIGHGGVGKQVRDMLHVEDLFVLINRQLDQMNDLRGDVFNVGGGPANSVSLQELTQLCREVTGNRLSIGTIPENRQGDVKTFVTDTSRVSSRFSWQPEIGRRTIVEDLAKWIRSTTGMTIE